jgi:hypothetical protein
MPLSPDAWAQIGTTLLNTGSQLYTNSRNRKNALEDWNRVNLYNAPKQQMQRYKEAGLNPNLIYGQQNNAPAIRSTDFVAPKIEEGALDVLGKSNKLKVQNQAMEIAKLQGQLLQAQINKTNADAIYVGSQTDWKNLDTERLKGQLPGLVDSVGLKNEEIKANIQNRIADTQNKVAQLPIQEATKKKIDLEIEKLFTSNKFIKLEKNTQLAVQNIMMQNMKILGTNMLRQGVTEGMKQEMIISQTKKVIEEIGKLRTEDVKDFGFDEVMDVFGAFSPFFKSTKKK